MIKVPMDLQFFADENSIDDAHVDTVETEEKEKIEQAEEIDSPDDSKFKYTDEDVDKIVQEKLAKAKKREEAKVEEAKKLAKMDADEKQQYELEQAQQAAKEAEAKLAKFEMKNQARSMLLKSGINFNDEDVDLVVTDDAETTNERVQQLLSLASRIEDNLKAELLKGKTPKSSGDVVDNIGADEFKKMSTEERIDLAQKNPKLFEEITGGH